ncbi:MAG: NUDIX domain-containing protein [Gemmatimonadaceae bacterium]
MPKRSAGVLLYRKEPGELEVLLVHPGGPFWARKDAASWSIPKGEVSEDEDPLSAAKREFAEETGHAVDGDFVALEPVKLPSGKVVHAWALEGDCDATTIVSNTFTMEWPPKSGRQSEFPEVDRAGWFGVDVARVKLSKGQMSLLDQLIALVGSV